MNEQAQRAANAESVPQIEEPATLSYAMKCDYEIRTHLRLSIFVFCICIPIGFLALICSYLAMIKIADEDFPAASRWGRRAKVICNVEMIITFPLLTMAVIAMMMDL